MVTNSYIENMKRLIPQAETIADSVGRDMLVLMIKKIIRAEEIREYRNHYIKSGCYFGYLLLQSQVFENHIKGCISTYENFLTKNNKSNSIFQYRRRPLEEMTLGELINHPFDYYFEYPELLKALKSFNEFRKVTIHHLTDDFNSDLEHYEQEIMSKYDTKEYTNIENMLVELSRRISMLFTPPQSSEEVARSLSDQLKQLTGLGSASIGFAHLNHKL